jgi:hypothetical protein
VGEDVTEGTSVGSALLIERNGPEVLFSLGRGLSVMMAIFNRSF